MAKLIWSPDAVKDLEVIADYISMDSERYAVLVVNKLVILVESAAVFPLSGRVVPELENEQVRERFYKSYRLIYRVTEKEIEILRIFHQSRELDMDTY